MNIRILLRMVSGVMLLILFLVSCNPQTDPAKPIAGTWKLVSGTLIEKGDTTVTDYTKNLSFIKIINDTHFSFLLHDTDSTKTYSSGGGRYDLTSNTYTEHLEYCSDRQWEGHDFSFTITIQGDTLTQQGLEEVADISRMNIEKYVRVKG